MLIDAGKPGSYLCSKLESIEVRPSEIDAILVTHEHGDHVQGLGVMARKFNIPIYLNENTWLGLQQRIGNVPDELLNIFKTSDEFEIGDFGIKSFPIPHDALEPVGFTLSHKNKKLGFATDLGHMTDLILDELQGSELVFLESNYDEEMLKYGPYPPPLKQRVAGRNGHLSNTAAAQAIAKLAGHNVRHFLLSHLSATNNNPSLAYRSIKTILESEGIIDGEDVSLKLTRRDEASGIFEL